MSEHEPTSAVVRVYDVLIVVFPNNPTDRTMNDLQEEVLERLHTDASRGVVLDLTNVDIMDSFFARTISETARMVRLMGGEPIVVGIQPSVALTAAELGYDLDDVRKARNTDQALEMLGLTMEEV